MDDRQLADRVRLATEDLNDAIMDAFKGGLRVRIATVDLCQTEGGQTRFFQKMIAEVGRPV